MISPVTSLVTSLVIPPVTAASPGLGAFGDLFGMGGGVLASAGSGSGGDQVVDYLPVLVMLLFATSFAALNLVVSWLAGSKGAKNPVKDAAYECGMPPITDPHQRFSVRFYLVALLFVLFDIEVVFLFPWAAYFQTPGRQMFLFVEMLVFAGILFFGWWYVMRRGAVDWAQE